MIFKSLLTRDNKKCSFIHLIDYQNCKRICEEENFYLDVILKKSFLSVCLYCILFFCSTMSNALKMKLQQYELFVNQDEKEGFFDVTFKVEDKVS